MESYELYYMYPALRTDPGGGSYVADDEKCCRIGDYTVRALPFRVSEWQKKYLIGGNGFWQGLFRFFCLRRMVKEKGCVVLAEKMQALLPGTLWYPCMRTDFPPDLQETFALQALTAVLQERSGEETHGREHGGNRGEGHGGDNGRGDDRGYGRGDDRNNDSGHGRSYALMVIAPPEGFSQELLSHLLQIVQRAINGERMAYDTPCKAACTQITELVFFTGATEEKEWIEDKLDDFLEETGVAGMCYLMGTETAQRKPDHAGMRSDQAAMMAMEEEKDQENRYGKADAYRVFLDFANRPLRELWNIDCYIDAGGGKSGKEIRRLKGRRISVESLRNYLDRAFYPTL